MSKELLSKRNKAVNVLSYIDATDDKVRTVLIKGYSVETLTMDINEYND